MQICSFYAITSNDSSAPVILSLFLTELEESKEIAKLLFFLEEVNIMSTKLYSAQLSQTALLAAEQLRPYCYTRSSCDHCQNLEFYY